MIAQDEIKAATLYEKTVINQNLDQAVLEVESIILNELKKGAKSNMAYIALEKILPQSKDASLYKTVLIAATGRTSLPREPSLL